MPRSVLAESAIKILKRKRKKDKLSHWLTIEKRETAKNYALCPHQMNDLYTLSGFFGSHYGGGEL